MSGAWTGDLPAPRGFAPHPRMGILTLKYPVARGLVENWDDWEKVLHSTFYDSLRIAPEEHRVVMVVSPDWADARASLEKLTQIMFETFNVPELLLLPSDTSAAIATKISEAVLVLHSGFDVTTATIVVDLKSETRSRSRRNIGGSHVTGTLVALISGQVDGYVNTREAYELGEAATTVCFVAPQPIHIWRAAFAKTSSAKAIPFREEEQVLLTTELFECTEILFSDPTVNVVDLCLECLSKSDCSPRKIVLDGGNTQWPGFAARLELELRRHGHSLSVVNPVGDRTQLAWCGASLQASQSPQSDHVLTKEGYDCEGPVAIHRFFEAHFF